MPKTFEEILEEIRTYRAGISVDLSRQEIGSRRLKKLTVIPGL